MSEKLFSFLGQKSLGDVGEQLFFDFYKGNGVKKEDGRLYDFSLKGETIELKTDSYTSTNYFMEQYGNISKSSLGGPWRALKDEVNWFVYFFIKERTFYWFEPKPLCAFLDVYILDKKPKIIHNKNYETLGWTVDRDLIKDLLKREDKIG